MNLSQINPLIYGSYLATVDVFALGILKFINLGQLSKSYVWLATLMYAIQPHVFLASMKYESMTVMNLLWDVISDVLVTGSGLLFFKEKLSHMKMIGLIFAFIGIVLLTWPDLK